jgi:hypothetical protein
MSDDAAIGYRLVLVDGAAMRYRLVLEDGHDAVPAVWYSPEGAWRVGDWIMAYGHQHDIMEVRAGGEDAYAVLVVKPRPLPA